MFFLGCLWCSNLFKLISIKVIFFKTADFNQSVDQIRRFTNLPILENELFNSIELSITPSDLSLVSSLSFISYSITFLIYISYIFSTTPKQLSLLILIVAFLMYVIINNLIGKRVVKISKRININNPIRIQKVIDFLKKKVLMRISLVRFQKRKTNLNK